MRAAKIIFVTGTDTGVGKTVLTALLLHHLRARGVRALAMKPFCSGGLADVRLLQSLQPGELLDREMNPYYFSKPLTPLVAAGRTRKPIRLSEVVKKIQRVTKKCDCLLIESSGGLMVPLGPGFDVADLIKRLNSVVVIAARNRLGTINHTRLTVGALRALGIPMKRLTVTMISTGKPDLSSRTNPRTLVRLLHPCPVFRVPDLRKINSAGGIHNASKKIAPVLEKIVKWAGFVGA